MLKVGITGGIGCGKTIISKIFSHLKVPVFNADLEAKKILFNNPNVLNKVRKEFGSVVFKEQRLNKQKLSEIVFTNSTQLNLLNSIIHPEVKISFDNWCLEQNSPYVLKEAAILFESSSYQNLDKTILVKAPENLRIKRVMKRDNVSLEMVKNRIKNQWSDEKKLKLANYVITNNDEELVIPQVLKIHEALLKKFTST